MTARDVIFEIESLTAAERSKVEAWFRKLEDAREDALDLAVIRDRQKEPTRDFRTVLSELGIKP